MAWWQTIMVRFTFRREMGRLRSHCKTASSNWFSPTRRADLLWEVRSSPTMHRPARWAAKSDRWRYGPRLRRSHAASGRKADRGRKAGALLRDGYGIDEFDAGLDAGCARVRRFT